MSEDKKPGPTGEYPQGKLREDDEGALDLTVSVAADNVFLNFGKPVSWLAMPPHAARLLASMLVEKAGIVESAVLAEKAGEREH